MTRKLIDGFLLIVVLIGGIVAWQTGKERRRLTQWHERLARTTGDLAIADPSKLHILALDTGDPLHFAWRMYVPPNNSYLLTGGSTGMTVTTGARPSEFIARVCLLPDDKGAMQFCIHFGTTSSLSTLGANEDIARLQGHWDRIKVEQLGAPQLAVIQPDQTAVFLRLTLPDELVGEMKRDRGSGGPQESNPALLEIELGPPPPTSTRLNIRAGPNKR
jgi:hypothetical protein